MQWYRRYVEVSPNPAAGGASMALAVGGAGALVLGFGWGIGLVLLAAILGLAAYRYGRRISLLCSMQGLAVQIGGQPERNYGWAAIVALEIGDRRPSLGIGFQDGFQLSLGHRTGRFQELVEFVTAMTPHLRESRQSAGPSVQIGRLSVVQISQGKGSWYG